MIPVKNACFYFQKNKGLITAIITASGNLSATLFTFAGESFINVDSVKAENDKFFDWKIGERMMYYFTLAIILIPSFSIVSIVLLTKYKKIKDEQIISIDQTPQAPLINTKNSINIKKENDTPKTPEENKVIQDLAKKQYKADLLQIFKNSRVWTISLLVMFIYFLPFTIVNSYKVLATAQKFNTRLTKYTHLFGGLGIILIGPAWGFLSDKIGFKPLLCIISCIIISGGCCLYFALSNGWFYSIITIFIMICVSGITNIVNPFIMKIYSLKYCIEVFAVVGLFNGLSMICSAIFVFFVSEKFAKDDTSPYLYVFISGIGLNLIALIIGLFLNNKAMKYESIKIEENKIFKINEINFIIYLSYFLNEN